MLVSNGDKVHIIYRALYEDSTRRHIVGEIMAAEGVVCRIEGYVFVYDSKTTMFERKDDKRVTIIDLAESGYIVNIIDRDVNIDEVNYRFLPNLGLAATDGKNFVLNINEFGRKS